MTLLFCPLVTSCDDNDDRLADLDDRVSALESAIGKLQQAFDDGKTISGVSSESGKTTILFTDGTSVVIRDGKDGADGSDGKDGNDGKDGVDGADGADGSDGSDGKDGADGKDGERPLVAIDDDGHWAVSYDNGATFVKITGSDEMPVAAAGKDGMCVRVVVTAEGYYAFELYFPSDPSTVVERIVTLHSASPAAVVKSIVKDEVSGIITLTMADGTEFSFNLSVARPSSIIVMADQLAVGAGSDARLVFRVNPSGAFVNFVTDGDNPNLRLDDLTPLSRADADPVRVAKGVKIVSVEKYTDENSDPLPGQYVATIRLESEADMTPLMKVALVYSYTDEGATQYVTSAPFGVAAGAGTSITALSVGGVDAEPDGDDGFKVKLPYGVCDLHALPYEVSCDGAELEMPSAEPEGRGASTIDLSVPAKIVVRSSSGESKEYTLTPYFSSLPVVFVRTPEPVLSKDDWVKKSEIHIGNTAKAVAFEKVQVKGRGNSTWVLPKKPYAIKLDKKSDVLGMPAHKRWCLLANYLDRTLLRNDVALEIGRKIGAVGGGLEWTPKGEFVDLVFNGAMVGNYYLCEQIKIDPVRVDINELDNADISAPEVTGGYLLELDTYFDEPYKFRSPVCDLPVNLKSPDENVPAEQLAYIESYFGEVETLLKSGTATFDEIKQKINVDSYIDWWIVHELTQNGEPGWPKSSYMYKKRSGTLFAGPIWDFDYATFSLGIYPDDWLIKNAIWYGYLFSNSDFVARVKTRWQEIKPKLDEIPAYIDLKYGLISESAEADCQQWPIYGYIDVNLDASLSHQESVKRLKDAYLHRLEWMDRNIPMLTAGGEADGGYAGGVVGD